MNANQLNLRTNRCPLWHWVCVWMLLSAGALRAQSLIIGSTTSAYQSWSPTYTILTEETANKNQEVSTVPTSNSVNMELVSGSNLTFDYGAFAGQSGPSALRFTYQIDKNGGTPNGDFVVLLDTDRNGNFDSGFGLTFATTGTSAAYVLTLNNTGTSGIVSSSAPTPNSVTFTTGSTISKYSGSTAQTSSVYTVSVAFLISDVTSTWQNNVSVPVTAFTTPLLSASTTYSGTWSAAGGVVYDWYGTSATTLAIGAVSVPETSTQTSIAALAGISALVAWRRRRRKQSHEAKSAESRS